MAFRFARFVGCGIKRHLDEAILEPDRHQTQPQATAEFDVLFERGSKSLGRQPRHRNVNGIRNTLPVYGLMKQGEGKTTLQLDDNRLFVLADGDNVR